MCSSDLAYHHKFVDLPDEACHSAFMMDYPVAYMEQNYVKAMADQMTYTNQAGLMRPLPWKISWPTSNVTKFVDFIESNVGHLASMKPKGCDNVNGGCDGGHYVELVARLTSTLDVDQKYDDEAGHEYGPGGRPVEYDMPIAVRFVSTPSLGVNGAKWKVKDFEEYVETVHALYMDRQRGWDRWIDNHIGFQIDPQLGQGYLDHLPPKLDANGVRWHAHLDMADSNEGSIWTEGVNGMAFEFHGKFDFSYFSHRGKMSLHQMSMCQQNGEMPLMQNHNESNWEQDIDKKLNPAETTKATKPTQNDANEHTKVASDDDDDYEGGERNGHTPIADSLSNKTLDDGLGEVMEKMRNLVRDQSQVTKKEKRDKRHGDHETTTTSVPTAMPSYAPTAGPTALPSYAPTAGPSALPSYAPTASPSHHRRSEEHTSELQSP